MSAINTSKGRILKVTIKGLDVTPYVRHIACRESICSSYLTADITVMDNDNVIQGLQLSADGRTPVTISFDAIIKGQRIKSNYNANYQLLAIKEAGQGPESSRAKIYHISVVGPEYWTDREKIVVESVKHITGCQLAQKVWRECGFTSQLLTPVQDAMITQGEEPFQLNYVKPFTALAQIRNQQFYPQYRTGNHLLYRDYYTEVLVPLQYLFDTLSAQENFIERETTGVSWRDIFESEHDIIHAIHQTRNQSGAGGGSTVVGSAGGAQGKRAFDHLTGKLGTNLFAATGAPNIHMNNTNRVAGAMDFTQKTEMERLYAARCKAGPQYNIRVPLQLGINITVGKGVNCKLLAPVGDKTSGAFIGGLMLVTDLVHEVWQELKPVTGTTTMQCMVPPRG